MQRIKVSAVSYLNTKPLIYGLKREPMASRIKLSTEYPAQIAADLKSGDTAIGLVPVAAIADIPNAKIITDTCIGADGAVGSVCIFSRVPIEQVETLMLDYQSRSSVMLAQVLLRDYWHKTVKTEETVPGYIHDIRAKKAGVVIGDRAIANLDKFEYVYDLGKVWKEMTGLPFLFAAWVSNRELAPDFVEDFSTATALGLQHLPEVVAEQRIAHFDLQKYYAEHISFHLDNKKREALELFLQKIKTL